MKYLVSFLCCAALLTGNYAVRAQVDPLYAQYLNNPVLINPGYTGLNNNFSAALSYRKQWTGFTTGNPVTLNVNAQVSLLDNRVGLGFIVLTDKIGNNTNTEAHATYSYKLQLAESVLSLGLQGGLINYRSDNGDLNPYDTSDPAFSGNLNLTKLSLGAGLIFRTDRLLLGVSIPRMLKQQDAYEEVVTNLYSQHIYASAAYIFFLSDRVRLKPSVLMRAVNGSPLSLDYTLLLNLDERYTGGVYTRNLNTYGALLQMKLGESYQLGYAFEMPSSSSIGTRYTTHEICLSLSLAVLNFHDTTPRGF